MEALSQAQSSQAPAPLVQALAPLAQTFESQGCVLVVDDIPANVRLLAGILKVAGFGVVTAQSGEEALIQAQEVSPDVVLLDLVMPRMDGFEVCRRLKAGAQDGLLPVVMVTALQDKASRIQALEAGADDFLTKPVDEVEVVARLKTLVRIKRQHDNLQRAYRELRRAEETRDSMMAMLVHDLRTPLTTLQVSLELLGTGQLGELNEAQQDIVEISQRGSRELLSHVNQLLDVHKMESGQFQLKRAAVDMRDVVQDVLTQIEPLAKNKQVEVVCHLASDLPAALLDQDLISRVLVNLLGNAIRFSPRDTVKVTVGLDSHLRPETNGRPALLVCVQDNGPGIPPQAHQAIFEKFGQVDPQHADRRHSTGIGLAFCKLAVEAHGGRIWVESAVGQGSTFRFTLPVGEAP